jgi:ABC-2 type transport system permease protein
VASDQASLIGSWRWHLALYRRLVAAQIKSQLQYRTAFVLDLVSAALFAITEFMALALVFMRFPRLGGWTLGEVALLYGLVECAFSVMDIVFAGFDPPNFSQYIRKGTFDQLLLRPAHLVVQVFGSDFTMRRIGRLLVGLAILAVAFSQLNIDWTVLKLLYFPPVILGIILYFGGLFIVGATINFWTVESNDAMSLLTYGGSYLISHPMQIYQDWLRKLFTFVIPAIFLNYYPVLLLLGKPDPFGLPPLVLSIAPLLSLLVGATIFILALRFWFFGLKHYQSSGS